MRVRETNPIHFLALMIMLLFTAAGHGQVMIKPYYGYLSPSMTDANNVLRASVALAGNLLEETIPLSEEFDGNHWYGVQLEYHLQEDLFASINAGYFRETIDQTNISQSANPAWRYRFKREVKLYDLIINLQYYINYNSWRRFNKYLGLGIGYMVLNANSLVQSDSPNLLLDSKGESTGYSLTGSLTAGFNYRLGKILKFWTEGGLQYGNFGQLDGTVRTLDNPQPRNDITETKFDLTGFFIRGGLGFGLPFFN